MYAAWVLRETFCRLGSSSVISWQFGDRPNILLNGKEMTTFEGPAIGGKLGEFLDVGDICVMIGAETHHGIVRAIAGDELTTYEGNAPGITHHGKESLSRVQYFYSPFAPDKI